LTFNISLKKLINIKPAIAWPIKKWSIRTIIQRVCDIGGTGLKQGQSTTTCKQTINKKQNNQIV
jgi:hypothetical protein